MRMETIVKFNEWLSNNKYVIEEKNFDDVIADLMNVHKFKLGGRNELDKYMKILITKYKLIKNDEKILEFKDIVKEFKKINKIETKNIQKKEKKMEKKVENGERVIEVDETLNTDKLECIEKVENAIKDMCIELMGNPVNGKEWKIKIMKNIYRLEIDENTKSDEYFGILIYGKKVVKRDIKLIVDYLTKKRKIQKKTIKKEKLVKNKEKTVKKIDEKTIKNEGINEIDEKDETGVEDNKKALYKELFGEDSDTEENYTEYEENETIDDIIVDLEEIEFNDK